MKALTTLGYQVFALQRIEDAYRQKHGQEKLGWSKTTHSMTSILSGIVDGKTMDWRLTMIWGI